VMANESNKINTVMANESTKFNTVMANESRWPSLY
jgi:hypothetical protein